MDGFVPSNKYKWTAEDNRRWREHIKRKLDEEAREQKRSSSRALRAIETGEGLEGLEGSEFIFK